MDIKHDSKYDWLSLSERPGIHDNTRRLAQTAGLQVVDGVLRSCVERFDWVMRSWKKVYVVSNVSTGSRAKAGAKV
jgi:hypothetical protein